VQLHSQYLTMLNETSRRFPNPKQPWIGFTNRQISNLFHELTSILDVEMLVELGAHAAEASRRFVGNPNSKKVLAFEANPYTFSKFNMELQEMQIDYRNNAVASECGQERIQIPNPQISLTPGNASILDRKGLRKKDDVLIEAHSLDCLGFKEKEIDFPKLITALWIDCEGAAGQILKSGKNLLHEPSTKMLFVELEDIEYWENQILAPDVFEFLNRYGFTAIARDFTPRPQYNVLFVRDQYINLVAERVSIYWQIISSQYD